MVLTPTYHAFDMYKVHHDAVKLPVYVESEEIQGMPAISASASQDDTGKIHLSLTNIDPAKEQELRIEPRGVTISPALAISGTILTSERLQDHNTFDDANGDHAKVTLKKFTAGATLSAMALRVILPPHSLVTLELG
jgi:alpha-N-arabinofuranosidase